MLYIKSNFLDSSYEAEDVKVLEGLEAVRKRPGMYIGDTDRKGLHHLIYEIVDNSIDEALAGYCDNITIKFHNDNSVEISDNGRGIPTGIHPEKGISAATIVFTILHAGGKFGGGGYKVAGGLHGVGASVTNALSEYLELTIKQKGKVFYQKFEKGIPLSELKEIREMEPSENTGTTVRFKPDVEMFPEALEEPMGITLDPNYIRERIKRSAYLNPKLNLQIISKDGNIEKYYSENGLEDFIKESTEILLSNVKFDEEEGEEKYSTPIFNFKNSLDNAEVEISFCYLNKFFNQNIVTFANNIHTASGGTHLTGFTQALLKVINDYSKNILNKDSVFDKNDVLEGINAVISFKTDDPKFSDQTKQKLASGLGRTLTYSVLKDELTQFFEENPDIAKFFVSKAENSKKIRDAIEKSRNKIRKEQTNSRLGGLPGKLADCTIKKREGTEIFLVEGDSAGGSAKQARNRKTQAIMPLKGKILNSSKNDINKIMASEEVLNLVKALKTDFAEDFNYSKLRYDKIIIMTDADVDGSHIAVLLLTFFHNQMPELIKNGHIYLAMPPLYVVKKKTGKGDYEYILDEEEFQEKFPNGLPTNYDKQRFKGLGEMNPDQLWETTMNPETRRLVRVEYNEAYLEDINKVFEDLMGKDVENRRNFIFKNALKADIDI